MELLLVASSCHRTATTHTATDTTPPHTPTPTCRPRDAPAPSPARTSALARRCPAPSTSRIGCKVAASHCPTCPAKAIKVLPDTLVSQNFLMYAPPRQQLDKRDKHCVCLLRMMLQDGVTQQGVYTGSRNWCRKSQLASQGLSSGHSPRSRTTVPARPRPTLCVTLAATVSSNACHGASAAATAASCSEDSSGSAATAAADDVAAAATGKRYSTRHIATGKRYSTRYVTSPLQP
jgi:hypothetical protein